MALTAPHPRVCWQLTRSLTAWSRPVVAGDCGAADAREAFLDVTVTKGAHDYAHVIPPGAFPPFRGGGGPGRERALDEVMKAVRVALAHPGAAMNAATIHLVVIVKDADVDAAKEHFERWHAAEGAPRPLLTVQREWGDAATRSAIDMKLGWMLETELQALG